MPKKQARERERERERGISESFVLVHLGPWKRRRRPCQPSRSHFNGLFKKTKIVAKTYRQTAGTIK